MPACFHRRLLQGIAGLALRRPSLIRDLIQYPGDALVEELPQRFGLRSLQQFGLLLQKEVSGLFHLAACVELLFGQGRRHIAYLVDQPTPSSQLKTQGYLDGAARFGLEPLVVRGVTGSRDGGYAAMQRLLQAHPEVDGVACSLDIVACGALRAIQDSGRRVPQDIAVVGTDNSIYCEICNPTLTSLDTMVFNSGVMIAHQLVDCLEGKGANRRTMLFTGIVRRESA